MGLIAAASGTNVPTDAAIFDANCAQLFRLDYHLSEFRRIVPGEVVRSYLPVEKQFGFAQQIIDELGAQEVTAIKRAPWLRQDLNRRARLGCLPSNRRPSAIDSIGSTCDVAGPLRA
jgi:hypothetical protein